MDGVLLLNKPVDFTSRDLVNKMSKKFNERKAGHTGTLDPFATGLMLLTFGKATKISTYLEAIEKTYVAELTLGKGIPYLEANVFLSTQISSFNSSLSKKVCVFSPSTRIFLPSISNVIVFVPLGVIPSSSVPVTPNILTPFLMLVALICK